MFRKHLNKQKIKKIIFYRFFEPCLTFGYLISTSKMCIFTVKKSLEIRKDWGHLRIFTKLFSGLQTPSKVKPSLFIVISTLENTHIQFTKKNRIHLSLLLVYVNFSFLTGYFDCKYALFWSEYQISANEVCSKKRSTKNLVLFFFLEVFPDKVYLSAKHSDLYRLLQAQEAKVCADVWFWLGF